MELSDLIESIDIVEFLSQYVDLKQNGEEWWGLSPFKDEKTPSFSVRKESNSFFDFSSGIGGNVFTFVKFYHKCDAVGAVHILEQYAGCSLSESSPRRKLDATMVCKRFSPPKQNKKASAATILPDDYMDRYEKREDKLAVWEAEGISKESLDRFNVYYDAFSNRLVYPIKNMSGKIVNVGGRTLDPDWKAKGQRKYNYFYPWGTMDTIYGLADNLDYIKKAHEVILFEGCKSVLIADTWGIRNCGAILTSHLNPNQMKILARLGCRVVFALDKDVRIRDDHNIAKLKQFVNVEYLWDREDLTYDKDSPVDRGEEVFRKLYTQRIKYK